jgi:hypothetical protein
VTPGDFLRQIVVVAPYRETIPDEARL